METVSATGSILRAPHSVARPWMNHHGIQSATPAYTVVPRDERDIVEAVRFARSRHLPVRVVGGGYSFAPLVPTGGVLIDMGSYDGITGINEDLARVRLRAGTRIRQLGDLLWERGLSIPIQGTFDLQAVAGAVSTGTHGTGRGFGCISSGVTWLRLVNGHGEIVEIDETQLRTLQAAKVSLGLLGVIVELELQIEPRFFLDQRPDFPSWGEVLSTLEDDVRDNRHLGVMLFPHDGSSDLYNMPVPEGSRKADQCWRIAFNRADYDPALDTGERSWDAGAGRSYHIFSVPQTEWAKWHEMEYAVPAEVGIEAVEAVRELTAAQPAPAYPVFVRWVAGDDAMISPFAGRDSVTISIGAGIGWDYEQYFRDYHDLMIGRFAARPHWGKVTFLTREEAERVYPRHGEFVATRREFDPDDIFLNDHVRALFA